MREIVSPTFFCELSSASDAPTTAKTLTYCLFVALGRQTTVTANQNDR